MGFVQVVIACFAALAALGSAVVALQAFQHEQELSEVREQVSTVDTLLRHRKDVSESGRSYVCLISYRNLSLEVREGINRLRSDGRAFTCEEGWCKWYRRCVGKPKEEIGDGSVVSMSEADAWNMGVEINRTMESYHRLGLLYSRGVVDKELFRQFLRLELRWESTVVKYILAARETFEIDKQKACLVRLIADINQSEKEVPSDWKAACSDEIPKERLHRRRLQRDIKP